MPSRSTVCPHCRQLNAAGDARCFRCGRPLIGLAAYLARMGRTEYLATRILIGLCLLNFLAMIVLERGLPLAILGRGPRASTILAVGGIVGSVGGTREIFRWLSAVYVHLGVLHLVMNLSALLWLGKAIEDSLGWWRMIVIFVLTGIGGFAVSRLYYGPMSPPTAGASGALFGLLGAQIAGMHSARDPRLKDMLLQYLAYAIAFAFLMRVNNAAHLGGFVVGFAVTKGMLHIPRTAAWDALGIKLAGFLLLLSVASQIAAFSSPEWPRLRTMERAIQRLSAVPGVPTAPATLRTPASRLPTQVPARAVG